ncbi:Calmodulin-interacting protein [Smittium culicis]|uniref:Calmodulin-interacting protein n=1 Tax=Smittium culicis TaxID=133412 RepID=A0A1R1YRF9_9FUNG|nr:Calmodulin-interacting protein [Smittium culicis]
MQPIPNVQKINNTTNYGKSNARDVEITMLNHFSRPDSSQNEDTCSIELNNYLSLDILHDSVPSISGNSLFAENGGMKVPTGLLLHGPSGCGKSLLAKICSSLLNRKTIVLDLSQLYSEYWGESEKFVRNLFANSKNSIIIIDNIDAVSINRSDSGGGQSENSVESRVLSSLLNELDGIGNASANTNKIEGSKPIIIATTNKLSHVDAALTRPGRFDRLVEIGLPQESDRIGIFKVLLSKIAISPDVDIPKLAKLTNGFTGSKIVQLVR